MINVGVIGLGMMGNTHLDVYAKRDDVRVLAVSDIIPDRLTGKERAGGNISGQAQGGFALSDARQYDEGMKLIADPDVALVDVCLPTPLHRRFAEAALHAGKHLLVEKPLAGSSADARAIVEAASKATGIAMPAMCMRFWPGWDWLKQAVEQQAFGPVRAAHFRRLATHPGGPFYSDGEATGGAILDLHIHDTDFIQWCFGIPKAVFTTGYRKITSRPDHVVTQYLYDNGPQVTAEGGWAMAPGFPFQMHFIVNFEQTTAVFDLASDPVLQLYRDGKREPVTIDAGMGYEREIDYLLNCIHEGRKPQRVTLEDAARSVAIVEAEARSMASGQPEKINL